MRPFCFLLVLVLTSNCANNSDSVKPEVKPLIEAVYASGFALARDQYSVNAQAEGYVLQKVVDDGSNVRKNDPLYIIESGQQSSRFDLARKNFALAKENYHDGSPVLMEARSAMKLSEAKMKHDSVNFERYRNLLSKGATTKVEFDRSGLAYENSRNEYRLQESRFEKIRNQLYLELENARAQLAIAGDESGKYVVRSDIDGKVFKTLKGKGELVRRGEPIAIIGDSTTYYLQLSIDELDVQRVRVGQEVLVTVDAFPSRIFHAEIVKVYPFVNQQQQSVRADAALIDKLPEFYSGLAVEANIVIRENNRALVLPRKVLRGRDSLKIKTDDGVRYVKVKTGIRTLEEIEIVEGIDTNTQVLID